MVPVEIWLDQNHTVEVIVDKNTKYNIPCKDEIEANEVIDEIRALAKKLIKKSERRKKK